VSRFTRAGYSRGPLPGQAFHCAPAMEVVRSKKAVQRDNERADAGSRRLNSQLSLYSQPPAEDVTLEDFEDFAVSRLRGECTAHVLGPSARGGGNAP
jgi:hypothetical protein